MQNSPPFDAALDERLRLIVASHCRLTGRELVHITPPLPLAGEGAGERVGALRQALWEAPCAIVAHGIESDPVFFYGNRQALALFEMDFAAFTRLPSHRSAEPLERAERAMLLERVRLQGYVDDYAGVRIASSGKRFMINAATVWNLVDGDGVRHGQAAAFADWQPL